MEGLWRRSKLLLAIGAATLLAVQVAWAAGDGWSDLAGPLRALAAHAEAGGVVVSQAPSIGVPVVNGRLLVEVRFRGSVRSAAVASVGGQVVRQVGRYADVLIAAANLRRLAALADVTGVRPPSVPISMQGYGTVVSEGVQLTNAQVFYYNNVRGSGARVAVIDTGFAGAIGSAEVPIAVGDPQPPSFRADGTLGPGSHGTAVAQIIADMAPEATIHLLAVDTALSLVDALNYVAEAGYQVACVPLGLVDGPFDDTHVVCQAVQRARAAGCLVVVAAGNFAQRHWEGDFTDRNHNGFNEFATGVEGMTFSFAAPQQFQAYLSWFETAGPETDQDYDLELYNAAGIRVAASAYSQNGDDPPADVLIANVAAGTYTLRIRNVSASGVAHFQLFVPGFDLPTTLQKKERSLSVPAVSSYALAVGATRGSTLDTTPLNVPMIAVDALEPFSSRGPTVDGRTKPDMLGPDVVSTSVTGVEAGEALNPFIGTSAAAAHVAGGAALLYSEDKQRLASDLAAALTSFAYNYWKLPILSGTPPTGMTPGQDNNYGWGRLILRFATGFDNKPPEITIIFPSSGQTILERVPSLIALIRDATTGVDPDTIQLSLDGVARTGFSYDISTGVLTYTVSSPLSYGPHSFALRAADKASNMSDWVYTTFQVIPPAIASGLQLITLPYKNVLNPDPSSIFLPPASGIIRLVRWLPIDTQYSKYHIYPDPWASLTPPDCIGDDPTVVSPPAGLGYFVNTPGVGMTYLNVQGQTIQDTSYVIKLRRGTTYPQGWNMIGNPYTSTVSWGGVEFITKGVRRDLPEAIQAGITSGTIYELKNTGKDASGRDQWYYDFTSNPLSAVMQPFKGYWVYVYKDTDLVIYSPGIVASVSPQSSQPWYEKGTWRLRLVAEAAGFSDPTLFIGAAPNCTAGYDAGYDLPKPPPVASPLQTCIVKNDWGDHSGAYAQDLRGRAAGEAWDIEVLCQAESTPVTLTWPDLNAVVPGDIRLVLEDPAAGKTVYMRTATAYTFDSGAGGVRRLTVRALAGQASTLQITGVTAQQAGRGGAVITFSVSSPCQAEVQIRNISGVVVRSFTGLQAEPAKAVTLHWNGVSDRGSPAPAGRYLVCVTARGSDGQVVQGVRPLQLGR